MASKPIKPPRKMADTTSRRQIPQPQADTTSDPVEGRVTDADKGKKYVEHMMSLNKQHHGKKLRCYVCFQSYVDFENAEEWARYWQPRLGTPIGLIIEQTLEKITIDHGTIDDPFPKREFDYPWKAEIASYAQRNSRTWANDATQGSQPTPPSEPATDTPPSEPLQPATPPSQDSDAVQPAAPHSVPPRRAVEVPADTPPGQVSETQQQQEQQQEQQQRKRDSAPIIPRRVTPTPPSHKRRT